MAEHDVSILALTFSSVWANGISMNIPKYHTKDLMKFFAKKKIATLEQLKEVMGNPSRCTIFRKLGELSYLSSYSHRGKYYTLKSIARFSSQGLWECRSVWFARFGNLLDTAESFINRSDGGYSATELKDILHVKTKHALIQLVRSDRLQRERIGAVYMYFSADPKVCMRQKKVRADLSKKSSASIIITNPDMAAEEAKATILLFCSMLNEKQRRLYAGLESLKLGHGGRCPYRLVVEYRYSHSGKGTSGACQRGDCCRCGKSFRWRSIVTGKKTPEIIEAIASVMKNETAGDPVSGCKWTHKTTAKIAKELSRVKIEVSANTVGRLLKQMNYSLRKNLKSLESGLSKPPDPQQRDMQFRYIRSQVRSFEEKGIPVISVDTKSREMIGPFHQPGRRWCREAIKVLDHDFPSDAQGVAIPYGIYDPIRNEGFVCVGTSKDTSQFAVDSISTWWTRAGSNHYPYAKDLLILADCGGSNGYRTKLWKRQLQNAFCNRFDIKVKVCHYPPGSSKWNPIEHRMFCFISNNWAAQPLIDYETKHSMLDGIPFR